ncbi:PTS sugar transporter subunit IIC, partial [Faecalibacillus faecis]
GLFGVNLIIGVIVACGYYAGGPAVQALLNVIPTWISNGLQITMGLLPAIGFGLLLMMIMEKDVACFFFLGFALSVYLKIPVTAIAIFGVIIAIVLTQLRSNSAQTAIEGGVDEDDDF